MSNETHSSVWPEVNAAPIQPGYVIWSGTDNVTGQLVWVVDWIDEDGGRSNIAVTQSFEKVNRFMSVYSSERSSQSQS